MQLKMDVVAFTLLLKVSVIFSVQADVLGQTGIETTKVADTQSSPSCVCETESTTLTSIPTLTPNKRIEDHPTSMKSTVKQDDNAATTAGKLPTTTEAPKTTWTSTVSTQSRFPRAAEIQDPSKAETHRRTYKLKANRRNIILASRSGNGNIAIVSHERNPTDPPTTAEPTEIVDIVAKKYSFKLASRLSLDEPQRQIVERIIRRSTKKITAAYKAAVAAACGNQDPATVPTTTTEKSTKVKSVVAAVATKRQAATAAVAVTAGQASAAAAASNRRSNQNSQPEENRRRVSQYRNNLQAYPYYPFWGNA